MAAVATFLNVIPESSFPGGFFSNIGREVGSCLSGGCDVIWHANQRIDAGIASKFRSAADPIKQAIEEASDHVLEDQLLFLERLDTVGTIHEERIAAILKQAMEDANSDADHISQDIKSVADETFDNYHCAVTATIAQVQQFINENFHMWDGVRGEIINMFNRKAASCPKIESGNFSTVYDNGKCLFDSKIETKNNWKIEELMRAYRAFLEFNAMTACAVHAQDVRRSVIEDAIPYQKRYHLWELALK